MLSYKNELDFENIVNKISFPRKLEDYRATYIYNAKLEDIEKFEKELKNSLIANSYSDIQNTLINNKEIFSPDVYLFHVGKLVEKDYNDAKEAEILHKDFIPTVYSVSKTIRPAKTSIQYINDMFSSKLDVVDISINTQNNELIIESSLELYGNKEIIVQRGENNRKKLLLIQSKMDLQYVISLLNNKDLLTICLYPNLGDFFSKTLNENNLSNTYKCLEILMKYAEYIDMDRLLVLTNYNYYNKYCSNFENLSEEKLEKLNEFTNNVESLLDDVYIKFNTKFSNEVVSFQAIKLSINAMNNSFIDGKFYTINELNDMAHKTLVGEIPAESMPKNVFKNAFNFSNSELRRLISNNPSSIDYLLKNDYLSLDDIENAYTYDTTISNNSLIKLLEYDILTDEKLSNYYLSGKIDIDNIKYLKDKISNFDLEKIVSNEKFIELYLDCDKREEFNKYSKLYKLIRIDGKTNEEKTEIAQELIGKNIELLNDDNIKELYYMGFIPIESLLDLSDNSMIIDFYLKGYIKPKDIRKLFLDGKISKDVMTEAVTNPNISFTKKLVFIYSIFQADEDEIIRDELLNSIPNKDEEMYIPQNDIVRQYQEEKMAKQNGNSSNLCKRWNILSNFDDNYSQKLFDDGHIEFFIPKINLYIVEKLYDSNNRTAYGAATYAINKEIYEANIDSIIKNNKINRSNLVKLHKDKEAFKLIHLESWGNQMNDFLNTFKK